MPLQATSGAASYDGFGGGVPFVPIYIEQIFATHLYTGNGSTQTITNGIDLSGKGGLVWIKARSVAESNQLVDTVRGNTKYLVSNNTDSEDTITTRVTSFNGNGFSLGSHSIVNGNGSTYASWTFRKQPKFFDVVTYTGDGTQGRAIPHSLGAVPGAIICRKIAEAQDWHVYHRSLGANGGLYLNGTSAFQSSAIFWNNTSPTSTAFYVGNASGDNLNQSGKTYVAYLFAHNAGGFGLSGADNVVSCGSYTGTGSGEGPQINLGYEPQWLLIKNVTGGASMDWWLFDSMRGMTVFGSNDADLRPNSAQAEENAASYVNPNATGFTTGGATALNQVQTYIYIAIRRGPMKTPTSGTSVFTPTTYTGNGTSQTESAGFPTDMAIITNRGSGGGYERNVGDRLRGGNRTLFTTLTVAENTATNRITAFDNMVGVSVGSDADVNGSSGSQIAWNFRRAPGFFDEVCYTGNGTSGRTVTHNLTVAPELIIARQRTGGDWYVYSAATTATKYLVLNATSSEATDSSLWNNTAPTSSVFTLGDATGVNRSNTAFVSYLFASCPGVSKVGSYTGTGTTKQIDCGFTGGARFVLIKRTDSTGDWYVWDSARGIVAGNDPYLLLNSTAAEVTNTDYIDTYSAGFEISSTAPAAINANGGTFIFLAIA